MEELDLKEIFKIFWNKKIEILLVILIFVVLGVIYSYGFVKPVYTSSTTLVLASASEAQSSSGATGSTNTITAADITMNSKLVSTYSELVKSKNVLRQVISNLNINVEEEDLRGNVSVASVKDTELIKISVTNSNPEYAAQVANEIAKVFTEQIKEIYNINNVYVVDEAEVSQGPSNINHSKDLMVFAFIGLIIASAYVIIANMLDTTVKTAEDIEKLYNLPVLASIPYNPDDNNKGGRG